MASVTALKGCSVIATLRVGAALVTLRGYTQRTDIWDTASIAEPVLIKGEIE